MPAEKARISRGLKLRLHIVNPNTTATMTQGVAAAAKAVAPPDVEIMATEPEFGPGSIEGHYDGAFAVPGMLARIAEAESAGAGAHVIACFDDTGLDAARRRNVSDQRSNRLWRRTARIASSAANEPSRDRSRRCTGRIVVAARHEVRKSQTI